MLTSLLSTALLSALLTWTPRGLWEAWPEERFVTTAAPCLRPAELTENLVNLSQLHGDGLRIEEVGRSVQDRPIHLLTIGHGPRKILLWSQMHGDEPSATPALLDIAHYLLAHEDAPSAKAILDETTLLMVPMLNPDGSEVYERRNAQGIDINRDALSLATPEGRLLKHLRDEHQPILGFNLHDQNRRTAVGRSGVLATNAVLAVSGDPDGTLTPGRRFAKRACSAIVQALAPFAPGGMARYDEDWSPRAFGDNLTAWGTPVVLIESGAVPPGGDFSDLTRLNFVAILETLEDLVRNDLADHDPQIYEELERNQSGAWADVLIRGGHLLQPGTTTPYRADLALNFPQDDREDAGCFYRGPSRARLVELGDARFLGASRELPAQGALITAPWRVGVRGWKARRWLDGEVLDDLALSGVGSVHWVVPFRHLEKARVLGRALAKAGRPRLEPQTGPMDDLILELSRPPEAPESDFVEAHLARLGGGSWQRLRETHSLYQTLLLLEEERSTLASRPVLRRGEQPSMLVLSPFEDQELPAEETILRSIWIDGVEVNGP